MLSDLYSLTSLIDKLQSEQNIYDISAELKLISVPSSLFLKLNSNRKLDVYVKKTYIHDFEYVCWEAHFVLNGYKIRSYLNETEIEKLRSDKVATS